MGATAAWAAAVLCAGCGAPSDLVAVSGAVQLNGVAMTGGDIQFLPESGGPPAFGEIQPDGTFRLTTQDAYDGAKPGTYWVTVTPPRGASPAVDQSAAQASQSDTHVIYKGPRAQPLNVAAGKDNAFAINIRQEDGWQTVQDD